MSPSIESRAPTFRSDFVTRLHRCAAGDGDVCRAARVSTGYDSDPHTRTDDACLISYLMRNRHGSPFEHGLFTWYVEAPLFVFREWQRHRVASYNETSGRYRVLDPVFYLPPSGRPLVQVGKPGAYTYEPGSQAQVELTHDIMKRESRTHYRSYLEKLEYGICREVARMGLPLNTYSSMYVTMNPRGLMNFLSLRNHQVGETFPTSPMHEIQECARQIEAQFSEVMPATHAAFIDNGRVAP